MKIIYDFRVNICSQNYGGKIKGHTEMLKREDLVRSERFLLEMINFTDNPIIGFYYA